MPMAIRIKIATTTIAMPAPQNNISISSFPVYYIIFMERWPGTKWK